MKAWAVGPKVERVYPTMGRRYVHETLVLHRVDITEIGGIGEPNAGEFLVETPCGYEGWVRQLNKNYDGAPPCEACLNGRESPWAVTDWASIGPEYPSGFDWWERQRRRAA